MASGKYVAYYRVSTARQGNSGLGLSAQKEAVTKYLNGGRWKLVGEFKEVESGRKDHRPELEKAKALCSLSGATLVVGKIDRLTRDTGFLMNLLKANSDVVFCDLPNIPAGPVGKFMITQMVAVAELEAGLISQRTKAALAVAKAKGVKLGGWRKNSAELHKYGSPAGVTARQEKARERNAEALGAIREIQGKGVTTLRGIASELNAMHLTTPRGSEWTSVQVYRIVSAA
jgi:DNA invertase Pin-like site-specific DNA recombinase